MINLTELDNDPWSTFPTKKDDLRALVAAVTWQPIETAPKDGTPILVLERYSSMRNGPIDRHYIEIARWDEGWRIDAFAPPKNNDPTHWMPLPEPPK